MDDRYADAGPESAVPETGGLRVVVDDRPVAVFRCPAGLVAFEDSCPHAGGPLSGGTIRDGCLVCPWHGYRFDAATGRCDLYPGAPSAKPRAVRVEGGRVLVAR